MMDYIFSQKELFYLDDIMPGSIKEQSKDIEKIEPVIKYIKWLNLY